MLGVRIRELLYVSSGIGTQGQTTFDRLLEEVLDIVPEGLELVLCQSDARALGKPSAVAQSNDKTKNILAMRSACVRVARSTPDGTPPPGLRSHS